MAPEKTLLVAVDVQNGFLVSAENQKVLPEILGLVERWHQLGGPIVFTRMFNYPGSPLERLVDYDLMQGPPETDLIEELQPYADRVVDKTIYSLFNNEGAQLVNDGGYETLAFCGYDTEACVLKSAFDAFDLGYVPLIIEDATASSFGDEKRLAGLSVAEAVLGSRQIITAQDFFDRFRTQ